jgi:hypothetical protein
MKARTQIILIVIVGLVFPGGASAVKDSSRSFRSNPKVSWARRTFCKLTWEEVGYTVDSPREACAAVRHTLRYEKDVGEEWPSAQQTWERGYGDCEDYASCVAELCRKAGLEASVLVFYPEDSWEGHAIATGRWKGKLWFSSNGWYRTVKSLNEAKKYVAREMGWGLKAKVNSTTLSSLVPRGGKKRSK